MNKTFKVVYNRARSGMTAVSEMARSMQGKGAKTVIAVGLAGLVASGIAWAEDAKLVVKVNGAQLEGEPSYSDWLSKIQDAGTYQFELNNPYPDMGANKKIVNLVGATNADVTLSGRKSLTIYQKSANGSDSTLLASGGKTLKIDEVKNLVIDALTNTLIHAFGGNVAIVGADEVTMTSPGNVVMTQTKGKASISANGNVYLHSTGSPAVFAGNFGNNEGASAVDIQSQGLLTVVSDTSGAVVASSVGSWGENQYNGKGHATVKLTGTEGVVLLGKDRGLGISRTNVSVNEDLTTVEVTSEKSIQIGTKEKSENSAAVSIATIVNSEAAPGATAHICAPQIALNDNVLLGYVKEIDAANRMSVFDAGDVDHADKRKLTLEGTTTINGEVKAASGTFVLIGETVFNKDAAIGKLEGADGKKTKLTLGNADATVHVTNNAIAGENLTLSATSEVNDALGGDVNALLEKFEGQAVIEGAAVVLPEGFSAGETTAVVGANGKAQNVSSHVNSVMSNTLDVSMVSSLAINRILMNDVRKRLGDIRSASGTHGAWVRYDGGKLKGSNSLKNNFTTVQVGIDTMPSDNAPRFGLAFAYTKSDADMKRGDADMDSYSLALYGTKTFDNGVFVDVIGRAALSKADYTVDGRLKGSADNTALSLSGEIGWRYDVTPMFFVEPQAEITYTYTDADTLKLGGAASYSFDTVDSLLGRAGFAAGLNCPDGWGNVYVHASAVHEFLGDATIRSGVNSYKVNGEDTWVEYGLGANINIGKNAYVYGGVERTSGATLDEEWRAHVGFRYSF